MSRSLFKSSAAAAFLLWPSIGEAFPDLIRSSYQACAVCHYSPTGGGPLTKYGRNISGSHVSTWGSPEEAETFYGLFNTDPIDIGGNSRYLIHHLENDQIRLDQKFWMQREISLVVNPSKNVSLVLIGGLYGMEAKDLQYRTYYGITHIGPFWARAGRFLPAFGLLLEDHTKKVSQFLSQGKETVNAEAGYNHEYFQVIITRVFGENPSLTLDKKPTVVQDTDWSGYTAKISIFPTEGIQLGVSKAMTDDGQTKSQYSAYHAFAGVERLYAQAEYQVHPNREYKSYAMIGFQPFKGFHIRAELDQDKLESQIFGTIVAFPRPHWQFTFSGSRIQQYFVIHYYL